MKPLFLSLKDIHLPKILDTMLLVGVCRVVVPPDGHRVARQIFNGEPI